MSAVDAFLDGWTAEPAAVGPAPTDEQQAILDCFATGDSFKVEAGAGTGKTTTLGMVAGSTRRPGVYLAFNKAIVVEAGTKMPRNVRCSTAHSLAYHAVGKRYRHRLDAPRMRSGDIASHLDIRPIQITAGGTRKFLAPWRLAGIAMRAVARFCQSADPEPSVDHVPHQEGLDIGGTNGKGNQQLAEHLLPAVTAAWADLMSLDGVLPFRHEHYLKAWQLTDPHIAADFICFDEAQDANPVMAAIVAAQEHAQIGWIGDSQQQIYAFTGAVNALEELPADHRLLLTQSWRFGTSIATAANGVLDALGSDLRLVGAPHIESRVGHVLDSEVRAVLCRTNARAMVEVIDQLERGRRPHLIGGGKEIIDFARSASDLQEHRSAWHPDLACFDTWHEVLEYVATDTLGTELTLLVDLVKRFGAKRLMAILLPLPPESEADVVVSTAHKAKGREWPTVRLAEDLEVDPDEETGALPPEELRLLYVAATRAELALDPNGVTLAWPELERPVVA